MALKPLHLSSNLARPGSCTFSPSSPPPHQAIKLPPTPARLHSTRSVATKNKQQLRNRTSSSLKCRANLHGCMDEVVRAPKDKTAEIPIVMYPSVVFPGATLQLQAFEFRHRIMMHTLLLQLQQGLLRFGVICSSAAAGTAGNTVGCVVRVLDCERLVDDRFFLTCAGEDRFRVVEIVRTRPYVVARIQVLADDRHGPEPEPQDRALMQQVERHLKNVAMLSDKLNRRPLLPPHQASQLHRTMHSAASFSFLVARLLADDRSEQQALLQMDGALQRLAREGMYLEQRSKYLAAIAAIKDAFQHLSCNDR